MPWCLVSYVIYCQYASFWSTIKPIFCHKSYYFMYHVCVDIFSLDKTPWLYPVPQLCIYLCIYIFKIYLFMLLLYLSFALYGPILVLGALLEKNVTSALYITMRLHSFVVAWLYFFLSLFKGRLWSGTYLIHIQVWRNKI